MPPTSSPTAWFENHSLSLPLLLNEVTRARKKSSEGPGLNNQGDSLKELIHLQPVLLIPFCHPWRLLWYCVRHMCLLLSCKHKGTEQRGPGLVTEMQKWGKLLVWSNQQKLPLGWFPEHSVALQFHLPLAMVSTWNWRTFALTLIIFAFPRKYYYFFLL